MRLIGGVVDAALDRVAQFGCRSRMVVEPRQSTSSPLRAVGATISEFGDAPIGR